MFFRSIRWRVTIGFLIVLLAAVSVLALYISSFVRDSYLDDLRSQLGAEARLIADGCGGLQTDTYALAEHYAGLLDARVTFIAADGVVIGESGEDRTAMDNHLYRPEVQQALATGEGSAIRYSETVGYEMMYVAVRGPASGTPGFVRVALPLIDIEADLARLRTSIIGAATLAVLGGSAVAVLVAERTAWPLRRLTGVVGRLAGGDLDARALPTTKDEVGSLTRAFNEMADRLRDTITSLDEEQRRLSAVLQNMADGVLITDEAGRVRLMNKAAADLLAVGDEVTLGSSFAQVTRDHRVISLWQQCHEQGKEAREPIELGRQGTFVQVVVTPVGETDPASCLVILQDLTHVRRLETIRRDFISNISHELRTPLASLKALVDTLRGGALEDPPAAQRFLDRMDVEVDALTQIVQELLQLSRIESGQAPLRLAPTQLGEVVGVAVERLAPQAERAGLELTVDVPEGLRPALADAERVQQVVTNLVHNAIKFTPAGGRIGVAGKGVVIGPDGTAEPEPEGLEPGALAAGEWILLTVVDSGVGIPSEDLPRIFERFYKADRARSGGGTGLGLAVAKHIVQAHGGHIWATSKEGHGSTFYVALPALNGPLT